MESTGVYWIPACQIWEDRGIEVLVVNARYAKNVSGRKTDALGYIDASTEAGYARAAIASEGT